MGLLSAWALGVGTMIGSGIFAISGEVAGMAGPGASLTYLLAGMATFVEALCFAELASARPGSGGPYIFVRDAMGTAAGWIVGWQLWVGLGLSAAFYSLGFARYLHYFTRRLPPESLVAIACLAAVTLINARSGHAGGALVQNLSVLFLLVVLAGLVVLGLPAVDPAFWQPALPYGWGPVMHAVPLVFTSFLGFETIAQAAGTVDRPWRTVPVAMLLSVASVTVLYTAVVAISTGVLHYVDLARTPTPLAEVARRLLGRSGAGVVALGGLLASLSSANGVILALVELVGVLRQDGLLPASWQPTRAAWVTAAAAGVAVLAGNLEWLARGAGLLHIVPFLLVPVAQMILRQQPGYRPRFRVPGGALIPLGAVMAMGTVLRHVPVADLVAAAALTLPGALWLLARRPPSRPWSG